MKNTRTIPIKLKFYIIFKNFLVSFVLSLTISFLTFFISFLVSADLTFNSFYSSDANSQCQIVSVEKTKARFLFQRIYKYNYEYTIDGKSFTGKSYFTKKLDDLSFDIWYKENAPQKSCIVGMKTSTTSVLTVVFYSLMAVLAIFLLIKTISLQIQKIKILKNGIITKASFKNKQNTGTKWRNDQYVYDVFFEFIADDGKTYQAKVRTANIDRFGDELFEPIIYDPQNPTKSVLIDDLPQIVRNFFQKEVDESLKI